MITKKVANDNMRQKYIDLIKKNLIDNGEEVLVTNSNEIALPCVNENGDDEFLKITFIIPSGSRDGDAYDGYNEAKSYEIKIQEKKEKEEKKKKEKEEKKKRDEKMREQKRLMKENRQ